MSFINSIEGNVPNSVLKYSTTEVQTDSLIATDATITNATITNLTTTTYTAVNASFGTITADTANLTNANIGTEVTNIAYINILNAVNADINNANINEISTGDIDLDTIILKEQSATLTDKSLIYRDANEILFVGRQDSFTATGTDFLFYTGLKAGTPKLRISRSNNIVDVIDLDVANILNAPTINTDNITVTGDTITNALITTDLDLKVLKLEDDTSAEESKILRQQDILKIVGSDTLNTPIHFYNLGGTTPVLQILNNNHILINGLMESTTIKGNLSQNLLAGVGISLSTTGNVTTITNTSPLPDPLTINTLNSTTINNSGNINNLGTMTTETAEVVLLFINDDSIPNKYAYISRPNNIWKFIANTSGITPIKFYPNLGLPEVLTITNTGILSSGIVEGNSIKGDLSQNLLAGTGIALSTTAGVTTITNIAQVEDPLNINTLNSTTINNAGIITSNTVTSDIINVNQLNATNATVSGLLIAPNIEGFTQSTEYAFQATSNQNSGQSVSAGNILNFNQVQTETPPPVYSSGFVQYGYDPVLKQYKVPESGRYLFGFKLFSPTTTIYTIRVGIFVNGVVAGFGGEYTYTNEAITCILDVVKGQWVDVRCYSGTALFYMAPLHSWFYGHKLSTANNLITSTTDLQVKNLITTNDITCNGTLTGVGLCNLTTISAANITSSGGIVGAAITTTDGNISGTLNTVTINNTGYINSPNAVIQTIDTGQNGTITLRSGVNTMDIYSNNGQFYISPYIGNLNLGSAFGGLGGVGLTMDATTKDITIHQILTTSTINNSGTITATTLNGDISNNLAAGTNVTLITAGGITTIASTPPTLPYLCVTLSSNYSPGTGSSYTLIYDTITALNGISYSTGTGIATIPSAGVYAISASVNIDDISINARINTRCRVRVNNTWIMGYPQGYGYARLSTEVPYASATVAEWMFFFNQNDQIDIRADVSIGTNTNFTSAFTGLQFFNGCCFTIKKID